MLLLLLPSARPQPLASRPKPMKTSCGPVCSLAGAAYLDRSVWSQCHCRRRRRHYSRSHLCHCFCLVCSSYFPCAGAAVAGRSHLSLVESTAAAAPPPLRSSRQSDHPQLGRRCRSMAQLLDQNCSHFQCSSPPPPPSDHLLRHLLASTCGQCLRPLVATVDVACHFRSCERRSPSSSKVRPLPHTSS